MTLRILFFYIIFVAGCRISDTALPKGIIPRDSMVTIMADIHIAESRLIKAGSSALQRDVKSAYLQQVLLSAGVDTSRFLKSFDYYSIHPGVFAEMYEDVVVEISKKQADGVKQNPKSGK